MTCGSAQLYQGSTAVPQEPVVVLEASEAMDASAATQLANSPAAPTAHAPGRTLSWWLPKFLSTGPDSPTSPPSSVATAIALSSEEPAPPSVASPSAAETPCPSPKRRKVQTSTAAMFAAIAEGASSQLHVTDRLMTLAEAASGGSSKADTPRTMQQVQMAESRASAGSKQAGAVVVTAPSPVAAAEIAAVPELPSLMQPLEQAPVDTDNGEPVVLVAKALTKSDATTRRIILPRISVETNMPQVTAWGYWSLTVQDPSGRAWDFVMRAWSNGHNPKPVYVLEHISDFLREYHVREGDIMGVLRLGEQYLVEVNTPRLKAALQFNPGLGGPTPQARGLPHVDSAGNLLNGTPIHSLHRACARTPGCTKPGGHAGWCVGHRGFKRKSPTGPGSNSNSKAGSPPAPALPAAPRGRASPPAARMASSVPSVTAGLPGLPMSATTVAVPQEVQPLPSPWQVAPQPLAMAPSLPQQPVPVPPPQQHVMVVAPGAATAPGTTMQYPVVLQAGNGLSAAGVASARLDFIVGPLST